jgi:hypothetical protein
VASETDLQRSCILALKTAGYWPIRMQTKGRTGKRSIGAGEPGLPDILVVGFGHLEVKLPGGKLRPAQQAWHQKARERGVNVAVVMSVEEALATVNVWRREDERMGRKVAK